MISIQYLDVVVKRVGDGLSCSPFLKDPRLSRRLAATSAHPISVHMSWPPMILRKMAYLSNSHEDAAPYVGEMRRRLLKDGCLVPSLLCDSGALALRRQPRRAKSILWLPLGFHPCWHRQVKKAVARLNNDSSFVSLISMVMPSMDNSVLKLAWRNGLPATSELIQR